MVLETSRPPDQPGALVAGVALWASTTYVVSRTRNMDGQSLVTFSGVACGAARLLPDMTPRIRLSLIVYGQVAEQSVGAGTAFAGRAAARVHAVPRRRLDRRGPRQSALFNYRLPDLVAGVHQRAPQSGLLG